MALAVVGAGALFQIATPAQQGNQKIPPMTKMPQVIQTFLPDLRITQVTLNGAQASIEITNQCKGPAPHSRLRLWLYKGATKNSGEDFISEFDVPPIAGGQKATVSVDLLKTGNGAHTFEGKYYRFEVDPLNQISEAVEGNNYWERSAIPFPDSANSCAPVKTPPPDALPDLRITNVTISGGRMFVEIKNQCKGKAAANRLRLYLYGGPTKGSSGGEELEADVPELNPGAKADVVFDLKASSSKFATFGDKYFRLEVDTYQKVKESIEGNNYWEKSAIPFPDPANGCNPN
jgi:hypothetical protein